MSEDNIKNNEQLSLDDLDEASGEEHLEAGSSNLSLDDLDSVAGGRGRRKYQPRRHIGPDARREEE